MSYILDALKRADAERERGAVPGLQSRHATMPAVPAGPGVQKRVWLAVVAALVLAGLAAGLWFWQKPDSAVRVAAVEPAVVSPAAPVPLAQPVPPPAPLPSIPTPPVVAVPRAAASSPPAVARAAPKPVPKPAPPAPAAAMQAPPKPKPEPVAKAPATQAAPATIPLLGDLPEGLRRDIPPLAISGSVYSANPAQRLLLVNNQVLGQGSQAAPGVNLEEIHAKSSVFSFRGTRFRVAH
ncbi:general secretion pathway protein GspB [Polaromonas hydrogenivorans]|uniref:General secretion pathway protein GspB n=1 Tax=Polaromonas hydrogenivorans TaxID=335476 RepID=A0AAU7LUH0_9BURK